jgi:hypothetical protein
VTHNAETGAEKPSSLIDLFGMDFYITSIFKELQND